MLPIRLFTLLCALVLLTTCTRNTAANQPKAMPALAGSNPAAGQIMAANIIDRAPSAPLAATSAALLDTPILEERPAAAPTATAISPTTAPTEAATATPIAHSVQRVVIDAIGLDTAPLTVGLDEANMPIVPMHDVGWYEYSGVPGQGENVVLWGHALRFLNAPEIPAPFGRLKELAIGAAIVLYDDTGAAHAYTVSEQIWATPDQVEYILPTGHEQLTMVSCIGDKVMTARGVDMTHRLITIALPAE